MQQHTIVMSYTNIYVHVCVLYFIFVIFCIAHYIAPKKARLVAAEKVKSNLRKAIGRKIEEELVTQASSEGENLRVLNTALKKKGKNS